MKIPEKHRETAHFWVDGEDVESRWPDQDFWYPDPDPEWCEEKEYRAKPSLPEFDWSQISDSFNYITMDRDGNPSAFEKLPIRGRTYWNASSGKKVDVGHFKCFKPGTCDWRFSLIVRTPTKTEFS